MRFFFVFLFLVSCTGLQNRLTSKLESTFPDRKPAAIDLVSFHVTVRAVHKNSEQAGEILVGLNTPHVHQNLEKYRHLMSPQHFECATSFAKVVSDYRDRF